MSQSFGPTCLTPANVFKHSPSSDCELVVKPEKPRVYEVPKRLANKLVDPTDLFCRSVSLP